MSDFSAAFYAKNVPAWERFVRITLAVLAAVYAVSLPSPWSWVAAGAAAGLVVTGLFGFCPACAMMGRRLARSKPQ
mgnify:CR=1 FL=1